MQKKGFVDYSAKKLTHGKKQAISIFPMIINIKMH